MRFVSKPCRQRFATTPTIVCAAFVALGSAWQFASKVSAQTEDDAPAPKEPAPPAAAEGETDEEARQLYLRGDRLYASGDYEQAVAAFEQAYKLSGRALLLYNMANAYERLGRYEEALGALRQYAPRAPAYEHDTLARRIRSLEQRLEGPEAREASDSIAVSTTLGATAKSNDDADTSGRRARRIAGYSLLGVGGAALAAGVTFAVLFSRANDDAGDACRDGFCLDSASGDLSDEKTFGRVADATFAIGAASIVTGLVLVLTARKKRSRDQARKHLLDVHASRGNVLLGGRF